MRIAFPISSKYFQCDVTGCHLAIVRNMIVELVIVFIESVVLRTFLACVFFVNTDALIFNLGDGNSGACFLPMML
jgi:hypothetical protein